MDAETLLLADFVVPESVPDLADPADICAELLQLDEFAELRFGEATIDFLLRREPKVKNMRQVLGTCYLPRVQGDLAPLFDWLLAGLLGHEPTFLIVLDSTYWVDATDLQREILVYHEISHAVQARDAFGGPRFDRNGLPVWAIRDHDVSEFIPVVRRYGAHTEEIKQFVEAIRASEENRNG